MKNLINLHEKAIKQLEMLQEADRRLGSLLTTAFTLHQIRGSTDGKNKDKITSLEAAKERIEKNYFATLHEIGNTALFINF